jgi:hypothetical protein
MRWQNKRGSPWIVHSTGTAKVSSASIYAEPLTGFRLALNLSDHQNMAFVRGGFYRLGRRPAIQILPPDGAPSGMIGFRLVWEGQ